MTPNQRNLLSALQKCGGVRDTYGRVVAEGRAHPAETVLWSFLHGWIASNGKRVTLTRRGKRALVGEKVLT